MLTSYIEHAGKLKCKRIVQQDALLKRKPSNGLMDICVLSFKTLFSILSRFRLDDWPNYFLNVAVRRSAHL